MGMGKTATALSIVEKLMLDYFKVSKTLVIAPKRVAETVWPNELQKWDHPKHLKMVKF